MDGGIGQKHMSENIKQDIKKKALLLREKRLPVSCESRLELEGTVTTIVSAAVSTIPSQSEKIQSELSSTAVLGIPVHAPAQVQLASIMVYLDCVFPFLFPFYRPSLLETGRQWLLGSVTQKEVSFHTAASLSAYFFSLVPQSEGQEMHDVRFRPLQSL